MRKWIVLMPLWVVCAARADLPVRLAWDGQSDGTIAGYKLYLGLASGDYTSVADVGNVTSHTLKDLVANTTYFAAVTAYNTNGLESELSGELSFAVPSTYYPAPAWLDARNSKMELDGLFALMVRGTRANSTIIVQASPDLIAWRSVGRVTLDQSLSAVFLDFQSPSYLRRFYRVFLLD